LPALAVSTLPWSLLRGFFLSIGMNQRMPETAQKPKSKRSRKAAPEEAIVQPQMHLGTEGWRHNNIGRLLNNALNRFEKRVLQILGENGHGEVRYSQVNLTRNLDLGGTITTELARRAGMTKQAMGEIVDQCEQLGLVQRVKDKRDARAKVVHFTKAGLEWLEAFRVALTQAEQEMRDELGYLRTDAIASALEAYGHDFDQLGSGAISAGTDD
jgi:DNA-binding MarR family transcriptional regulator